MPRIRIRFTIRGIMFATLLVCIVFGIYAFRKRMLVTDALNRAIAAKRSLEQVLEAADADIRLAESDLKSAEDQVEWADSLVQEGRLVIVRPDRLGLQRARFALAQAKTRRSILGFKKRQELKVLEAEIETLRAQLDVMGVTTR